MIFQVTLKKALCLAICKIKAHAGSLLEEVTSIHNSFSQPSFCTTATTLPVFLSPTCPSQLSSLVAPG